MKAPAEPPLPRPEPSPSPASRGRFAQLIAAGILLSRISGLVREMFLARYFGTSDYADIFKSALRMPNVLQNLLGEGTLSASFIPVYAELLEKRKVEEAGRVAGAVFALLIAVAGALTLFGILLAPVLVSISFPGFTGEKRALTIACTRIIFPMAGFLVLSAWTLGVLNSHRRFFLPYVAPVLWNVAIIATLVWFGTRQPDSELVVTLAWGAFVGGILQFAVQLPRVLKLERNLKVALNLKLEGVRRALRTSAHAISGRGGAQLSGWVDNAYASVMGMGGIAVLGYAQTLYMLPVSLFGMSVAAAELPELARNRGAALEHAVRRVNDGLQQIAVLVVPSVVGYLLLGDILVAALFQRGEFTERSTTLVTLALICYTVGLFAVTATRLFSSAFFAMEDTRTPARVAYVRVAVSAAIGGLATLYVTAPSWAGGFGDRALLPYGPVGVAAASAIGAWLEWFLLRRQLRMRMPGIGLGRSLLLKLFGVALGAALLARAVVFVLPAWHPVLIGVLVVGPYAALYLGVVNALGIEARIPLVGRFLRRRVKPSEEQKRDG